MVTIHETDSLAVVVTKLKRHYRLSYAQIGRVAGLSRNGVKQIADGKTLHPDMETLCRLAVGLVADPDDETIDQEELAAALAHIGRASGYGALRESYVRTALPVLLAVITADLAVARAWLAIIEHQTPAVAEEIRAFDALITSTRERRP